MTFELPELNYDYSALEPYIDAETMEIHHSKHHKAYTDNLNVAIEKDAGKKLKDLSIEEILRDLSAVPDEIKTAIRNNGGGFYNHSLFWRILTPKKTEPSERFTAKLADTFGSFPEFVQKFNTAAITRFGSGWAWLLDNNGLLEIESTANQDCPLMEGKKPLLGLDVWEHAYYLNYQNRRGEYVDNFWHIVNWPEVEKNLRKA